MEREKKTKHYALIGYLLLTACCLLNTLPVGAEVLDGTTPPAPSAYVIPDDQALYTTIRVAVRDEAPTGEVIFPSGVTVMTLDTGERIGTYHFVGKNRVTPTASGFMIGNVPFKIYGALFKPSVQQFTINGSTYRGNIGIIRQKDMSLTFVNYIDVDDYLKGVLPREIYADWPPAVLKTQAIAARTYAIFSELSRKLYDYSLKSTVLSQMYGGLTVERDTTTQAVAATRGYVLTHNNTIFPTYFHANCGGHTTRAESVWNVEPHPSLEGVRSRFCIQTKHYQWQATLPLEAIETALNQKGITVTGLSSVSIPERDNSGRAVFFALDTTRGMVMIPANTFRLTVGPEKIRSTKITALVSAGSERARSIHFTGLGWGHGGGMCQWGAKVMAEEGMAYRKIIRFYYPHSVITQLYEKGKSVS